MTAFARYRSWAPAVRRSCLQAILLTVVLAAYCLLPSPTPASGAAVVLSTGSSSFVFAGTAATKDKPITVWYHKPARATANSPIVFIMHGVERNGQEYRDAWAEHAEKEGFILLAPEFSQKYYPDSDQYNLGNMYGPSGELVDKSLWSYTIIEDIFDHVKEIGGLRATGYSIYGHSAGAQFVHRLVLCLPQARVNVAISANAGWYTLPTLEVNRPYGLAGSGATAESLKQALGRRLIIMLGDQDTDENHKYLNKSPGAMAQGPHRFARGKNFFAAAQRVAASLGTPLNWRVEVVQGVGHNNTKMAKAAAKLLVVRTPTTQSSPQTTRPSMMFKPSQLPADAGGPGQVPGNVGPR